MFPECTRVIDSLRPHDHPSHRGCYPHFIAQETELRGEQLSRGGLLGEWAIPPCSPSEGGCEDRGPGSGQCSASGGPVQPTEKNFLSGCPT